MKTTIKLLLALTMFISVSCSKRETVDTHKLKETAWLREKFENKGTSHDVPPYYVQFESTGHYTSLLSDGEYTFDNETGKLVFKGDATEYTVTFPGDKMEWKYGTKSETFQKITKADPKRLIGKWKMVKLDKFNPETNKWEEFPGGSEPAEFKTESTGTWYGAITYSVKYNVIKIKGDKENRFITELTNKKLVWIEKNVSLGILRYEWKRLSLKP